MPNTWPEEGLERLLPTLPSCFTLRRERFGGIFFNPFFSAELELDPIATFAIAMCDGRNSCRQVESAVGTRFGLDPQSVRRRLQHTARRVSRMGGLTYSPGDEPARPHIPDAPVYPADAPALSAPKSVIWDVTYACQLRCAHCLTDSGKRREGELDTAAAISLIRNLAEAKVLHLALSGGEPFLRRDLIDLIRAGAETNMRIDLATNGVDISARKIRALRDLPVFQVQVSIDGLGDQHDRLRGRAGAFAAARWSVAMFREEGIAVGLSTTVSRQNIDVLDRLVDLALEWGCAGYKAIPFLAAGRGKRNQDLLALSAQDYLRFAQTMTARQQELRGRLKVTADATFAFLLAPPTAARASSGLMGCSAGYDTLSIGADGTAYPCPFLQEIPLGNLLDRPLRALWRDAAGLAALRGITKSRIGAPCNECAYAAAPCGGGCRASALLKSGDLLAHDPTCFRQIIYSPVHS